MLWFRLALARVHGTDEGKVRGEGDGLARPRNRDDAVFERLSKDFEHLGLKFREFIQEQNATMWQGDFPRAGDASAAYEACVGDGVVRRPERTVGDESGVCPQERSDAINARHFERLVTGHRWKDGRDCAGEQGFPTAGGAAHDHVVSTSGRHLQCAFHVLLAGDIGEVGPLVECRDRSVSIRFGTIRRYGHSFEQVGRKRREAINREDVHAVNEGSFGSVCSGDKCPGLSTIACQGHHREDSMYGPDVAVQR
jgi:hypothetical protein